MSRPRGNAWRLRVPASSANLGPGFDCLGVAIDLELRLECRRAERFTLELHGEGTGELPRDRSNLLVRALIAGTGDATPPPLALRVDNRIPLARGLGSSSAATVAGLALAPLLAGVDPGELDRERLLRHAVRFEGHADNVAPAIYGDLVVSGIEDDEVVAIRERWPEKLRLVIVVPELHIETGAARDALPTTVSFDTAATHGGRLARLLAALHANRFEHLRAALDDPLHQPHRLSRVPGLADVLAEMNADSRALGCYLSGSGPTLVALCRENMNEVGEAAVASFARRGVEAHYEVPAVDRRGLECEIV